MGKFIFKKRFKKRSKKDLNTIKRVGCLKEVSSISVFQNESNGVFYEISDVQKQRFKRNKLISHFFEKFSDKNKFQLFEFGLPYDISQSISPITQKLKRRCETNGIQLHGYIWVYDVGEENFGQHYHLVLATSPFIDKKYPDALKMSFKKKNIHGAFVRNAKHLERYLKGKQIFERGYRKRLFGKSNSLKF
ncbi:hypothetical protein LB452_13025 [Psychroflexus sp. CAK8W]|uniref:Bacteriophage replication gene A protein (GPA) n=1 Tax=Psychroflexus longus TaxID=2873596 RepID=A0ABS7XN06_9FLAO|nr:hypothetical protein [Psychroflexus longus]MBZ9779844.1 hypothetical protein [Psychroflexus longus]